jgi:hypothetical protein
MKQSGTGTNASNRGNTSACNGRRMPEGSRRLRFSGLRTMRTTITMLPAIPTRRGRHSSGYCRKEVQPFQALIHGVVSFSRKRITFFADTFFGDNIILFFEKSK